MSKLISLRHVSRSFLMPQQTIQVLDDVSFDVDEGDFVAIEGTSGSGKSTLLHMIGLLDEKYSGDILYRGQNAKSMSSKEKSFWLNKNIGFVFQFFHLISSLTVLENVMLSAMILRSSKKQAKENALRWIKRVHLDHRLHHFPHELSGGEQQRVAIARALCNEPLCMLLDEPTGNLDDQTSLDIQNLIEHINHEFGVAMIVVTHDQLFAQKSQKRFYLSQKKLLSL